MANSKLLNAAFVGISITTSSLALAGGIQSESDFINKTLLGNWQGQTISTNDEVRNVDISKDRFLNNILSKFKIVTKENKVAEKNIDASLKRYTEQFGQAKKS